MESDYWRSVYCGWYGCHRLHNTSLARNSV